MPRPDHDIPQPVRPPILPPDFPDIPQNPSSELQPPPSPTATPDKFAGTVPAPSEHETLRRENGRLRDKINEVLEKHPELRDATDETQGLHVEVGTPFLERVRGKLQERARAIIERRPDLERLFDD
jgi:hypothetical protein